MVPKSFFRTVWESQLRAEMHQELFSPEGISPQFLIFMQVFFSKKHAFHVTFDVEGHLNGKDQCLDVTVYAIKHLVQSVRCQDTAIRANPVFRTVAHTSESVAGQAVRSSGKDRKLRYFRREHFQRDVSCSLDLSQIQFLQLLICHKELQVLVKADILCHLNPNASKQTHKQHTS